MSLEDIEILIPTYKEAQNLPITLRLLKETGITNITILDAKSEDGTEEIAIKNNCKIIIDEKPRLGFGHSLINGINASKSKYLCVFDADGSFEPRSIIEMYKLLKKRNLDFVFGSRYLGGNKSDDDTLLTILGNYIFTKLINLLFNFNTSDALFLYLFGKTETFQKLELEEQDFKICTEALIKANLKFNCDEIFSKEHKRLYGSTKVNRFLDGFKIMTNIIKMYINQKKI